MQPETLKDFQDFSKSVGNGSDDDSARRPGCGGSGLRPADRGAARRPAEQRAVRLDAGARRDAGPAPGRHPRGGEARRCQRPARRAAQARGPGHGGGAGEDQGLPRHARRSSIRRARGGWSRPAPSCRSTRCAHATSRSATPRCGTCAPTCRSAPSPPISRCTTRSQPASTTPCLADAYRVNRDRIAIIQNTRPFLPDRIVSAMEEHLAIIDALARRDADAAVAAIRLHYQTTLRWWGILVRVARAGPAYSVPPRPASSGTGSR